MLLKIFFTFARMSVQGRGSPFLMGLNLTTFARVPLTRMTFVSIERIGKVCILRLLTILS
jgi:hypothetical protein